MLVGATCVTQPVVQAEIITWETDFAFIKFDWNNTWNEVAFWAYGMYLLDIPDWAYLFSVYGMGWNDIWGAGFWGANGTWGAEDKLVIQFQEGHGTYEYYNNTIYFNISPYGALDLVAGGWVNTLCNAGRAILYYDAKHLIDQFVNYDNTANGSSPLYPLDSALAFHLADVVWPWGDHVMVEGYDVSMLSGVRAGYQHYNATFDGWWGNGVWNDRYPPSAVDYDVLFNILGMAYVICDYDYLFGTVTESPYGMSSLCRVATVLTFLRDDPGHANGEGAYMLAYGHHYDPTELQPWLHTDDPGMSLLLYWLMFP